MQVLQTPNVAHARNATVPGLARSSGRCLELQPMLQCLTAMAK
jgi:hypothetical protein